MKGRRSVFLPCQIERKVNLFSVVPSLVEESLL